MAGFCSSVYVASVSNIFGPAFHKFLDQIQIKISFRMGQAILAPLHSMTNYNFKCNLINADSLVAPDTLIDLLLN
jgi:hypothetical protein